MYQRLNGICDLKVLMAKHQANSFNLFIGAGVSRDSPANGPIWSEMQTGFLMSVFDRMEEEGWSILTDFPSDREAVRKLSVRPETFWRLVSEECGAEAIKTAFAAVNAGSPNVNHQLIARMLASRVCTNVMTTNFDDYIERLLPHDVPVWVPTVDVQPDGNTEGHRYIKLHGSLEFPYSLSYTLEHYDSLTSRNLEILRRTASGKPLIILGYSGYDTDVLPAILEMKDEIPLVVVVQHPGSNSNQPIINLASRLKNGWVIESSCDRVLAILSDNAAAVESAEMDSTKASGNSNVYRRAADKIPLPLCPLMLMVIFGFVSDWSRVSTYAKTAHDAAVDYQSSISPDTAIRLHLVAGEHLVAAGNNILSDMMFQHAKSIAEKTGSMSQILDTMLARDIVRGYQPAHSHNSDRIDPSEAERGLRLLGGLQHFLESTTIREENAHKRCTTAWQAGLLCSRSGDCDGAIEAFSIAGIILMESKCFTHLEMAHFSLDFASALFHKAMTNGGVETLNDALETYSISEKEAEEIQDWRTHAKALFMNSKILLLLQRYNEAHEAIESARASADRTSDEGLKERIAAHRAVMEKMNW